MLPTNAGTLLALTMLMTMLLCVVLLPRRVVPSRGLALFRSFFPAWRFFESIAETPQLSFRVAPPAAPFGPWALALPRLLDPPRLWLNAAVNVRLACQSLIEQFESELDQLDEPPHELVSYRLVQSVVLFQMRQLPEIEVGSRYEFRLTSAHAADRELFRSQTHQL